MQVFTYFTSIQNLADEQLLNIWERSWSRYGWNPIILTERDALMANQDLCHKLINSPVVKQTKNGTQYSIACLLRWVAMSSISGLSLHVDWDVLCNGFTPSMLLEYKNPMFYSGTNCPCAVSATQEQYIKFSKQMLDLQGNKLDENLSKGNCDDQYMCHIVDDKVFDSQRRCDEHQNIGISRELHEVLMIHFPNGTTPKPRSKFILERYPQFQ